MAKTFVKKPADVTRNWYVIDASEAPLGRVATQVAKLLVGKHKVDYTPHVDGGDFVVVINTDKIVLTGRKLDQKRYYSHSGYPGSIKEKSVKKALEDDSRDVMFAAVKGMIPTNKLKADRLARLKIFTDANHAHEAQKPSKYELKAGK